MSDAELCYLPIAELARRLASRELSPVELTEAYLRRVEALDPVVHAYITITADRALADARRAEQEIGRGDVRGPLHGIPIALKDLYDTAGIRTTAHSRVYLERVPAEDAVTTAKLRAAGTVLLGKLALHEFATGAPDQDGPFPPARNPWDLERQPSGSSSGSAAALAAGLCAGALGSDTGGSIRGPASWCGIVGHKPTYGLVSRHGVIPLSWTLDHAGPMARTVEDCAILLEAIAGYDPLDDGSANVPIPDYCAALGEPVTGLRVGVPRAYLETVSALAPETRDAFDAAVEALAALGTIVVSVDLPYAEHVEAIGTGILVAEAYAFHEERFRTRYADYGKPFKDRVVRGGLWSAADYVQATRARARFCRALAGVMAEVDVIAMPTSPTPAEPFPDPARLPDPSGAPISGSGVPGRPSFTRIFNITGQPSISVPCGFTPAGLPIGLMLSGRPFEDATVLRLAHAYERAHDWHRRRPPLSG
ncbi:MAG: amidase [Chloroflexota bacterium]|nr:amidase [Chloroflexota bacterium]